MLVSDLVADRFRWWFVSQEQIQQCPRVFQRKELAELWPPDGVRSKDSQPETLGFTNGNAIAVNRACPHIDVTNADNAQVLLRLKSIVGKNIVQFH